MKSIVFRMYLVAAVWALIGAVINLVIMRGSGSEPPGLAIALDLGMAIIVFFTGRLAKTQNASPWRTGSISGGIYGLLSAWPTLFVHVTRAQLLARLKGRPLSPSEVSLSLRIANSPAAHWLIWLVSVVFGLILGLIIGGLGGATVKRVGSSLDI